MKFFLIIVIITLSILWYVDKHKEELFVKMYNNPAVEIVEEEAPQAKPDLYIIKPSHDV